VSIKRVECYTFVCDWPDCDADGFAHTEYSGGDRDLLDSTIGDACGYGWHVGRDRPEDHSFGLTGPMHFCPRHPATWASDHENGEPFPEPPYLLIHDSDTDNPDDDGKVTLILPPLDLSLFKNQGAK
jgi:hypothetical protein